jgi:hypothetical protein
MASFGAVLACFAWGEEVCFADAALADFVFNHDRGIAFDFVIGFGYYLQRFCVIRYINYQFHISSNFLPQSGQYLYTLAGIPT